MKNLNRLQWGTAASADSSQDSVEPLTARKRKPTKGKIWIPMGFKLHRGQHELMLATIRAAGFTPAEFVKTAVWELKLKYSRILGLPIQWKPSRSEIDHLRKRSLIGHRLSPHLDRFFVHLN